jgi:hypothetical protein
MTEEEYLGLKEYLRHGLAYVDELRKQLPISNKLIIPSFLPNETRALSDKEIECQDLEFELLHKIGWQEIDNDLAGELIRSYEYDKNIK